ncbi:hypothetical protein I5M27_06515 [Adhaeribacter sp. BT258]|uniref:Lipoprotein n=1 Tax=Adhaeribacter terrigena TaxID=2793070 RepID=A0ABS1BZV3_9BACT|nr:hypothetical protein [Adhaeribacter terrigena]MBK0402630.1 hypothetical protein [Adhaeribacter terrigena]
MIRSLFMLAIATILMLSSTSCSSSMRTAEGRKYKPLTKFNFRFNNNQVSSASVYKRYVAYNKKQESKGRSTKPQQVAKKSAKPQSTTAKKGLLAVH